MKDYLTTLTCIALFLAVLCTGCEPGDTAETTISAAAPAPVEAEPAPAKAQAPPQPAPVETEPQAEPAEVQPQPTPAEAEPAPKPVEAQPQPAPVEMQPKPTPIEVKPQPTPAETQPAPEGVAATVNGVDITEDLVQVELKPQLDRLTAGGQKLPPGFAEQYKKQIRQQILERMVVEKLLDEKVKENGIVITDEQVKSHIEQMASQQGLPMEDFEELVKASGHTLDEVQQRIRKGLGYQQIIEAQWSGRIDVNDEDARKHYSENKSQFETPEQFRASHILIKPDPNADPNQAKAAAKAKAEDLLKQIRDGANFAELAKAESACPSAARGGDLNFFSRGQMVPPFEQAAFALKVGQVSDVVETRFGYHIIKLTDHKDASVTTFEQAKDDIVNMLEQRKQAELAESYIESLKADANIAYY